MALEVSIIKNIDDVLVSFNGQIDVNSYDFFIKKLHEVLLSERQHVLIDFSKVRYISSLALSAIIEARNYTVNNGGKFILVGLNESIRQVFELIGALEYMELYETLAEPRVLLNSNIVS